MRKTPQPPLGGAMRPMRLMRLMGLMGLIGLMGLMSCSKEQEDPQPLLQEVISFSGGLQEGSDVVAGTRAETSLAASGVHSFQVWAFKNMSYAENPETYGNPQCVIPGYTVSWVENSANTTTTNTSGWEYVNGGEQTIKYWDLDAKAYRFIGYVPPTTGAVEAEFFNTSTGENGAYEPYGANGSIANYSKCRLSFTADAREEAAAPYFSKLWFSNNSPGSEHIFPSMVQLQFFKPFARVRFMFKKASQNDKILIELPHFFPADPTRKIHMSGTFSITYPLTGTDTKDSWETNNITYSMTAFTQEWYEVDANETNETLIANKEYWYTVLPTIGQGAYTLTVRVDGEERTCNVPGEYMDWQPGYSYTYIFKANEDGGVEFDAINVAFTQWQGDKEAEKRIYNW